MTAKASKRPPDFLSKIKQLGSLCYPLEKCINVLDLHGSDVDVFIDEFDDPDSEVANAYAKGKDASDFFLDSKLFELARGGDLKAMQLFEQRRNERDGEGSK
jgi:hypothetical protein